MLQIMPARRSRLWTLVKAALLLAAVCLVAKVGAGALLVLSGLRGGRPAGQLLRGPLPALVPYVATLALVLAMLGGLVVFWRFLKGRDAGRRPLDRGRGAARRPF